MRILGLRIDVDTASGGESLSSMLAYLSSRGAGATVYVPGGTDESHLALHRVFRQQGYLKKLLRTRALSVYGRQLIRNVVQHPTLPRSIGYGVLDAWETGIHGMGHTRWHNEYGQWSLERVGREMDSAVVSLKQEIHVAPTTSAAPGWQADLRTLWHNDRMGFAFASDVRGPEPFLPSSLGLSFSVPQVPVTLPTLDEFIQGLPPRREELRQYADALLGQRLPVVATHTELEGGPYRSFLDWLLDLCASEGFSVVPLSCVLAEAQTGGLPRREVVWGSIPGRPGRLAISN